jgi:hypothetical protein
MRREIRTRNAGKVGKVSIVAEKPLLEPLVAFVERVSSQDEIFSLKQEALLAKHTLTFFNPLIQKHIEKINGLLQKEKLSSEESKSLLYLQNNLKELGDSLNETLKKVSYIVRTATEIEDLKASRVDGIQLLHALRQIPGIISGVLEMLINDVISDIDTVVSRNVDNKTYLKILRESEYLGKTSPLAVAKKVTDTVKIITARLEVVSMPINHRHEMMNNDSKVEAVEENRIRDMIDTVPRA